MFAVEMKENSHLPNKFVPVGGCLKLAGKYYRCVERPAVGYPAEACSGCSLALEYRSCDNVQCSKFDRPDGKNVWFKRIPKI